VEDGDEGDSDEGDEGDGDDGWETIYNEDFREWKMGNNGEGYLIIHTYGGGPAGGYIACPDGPLYAWHQEWHTGKERTRLPGQSLRIRRAPGMPADYEGAQGLQVKVTTEEVGDSVFDYAEPEPEPEPESTDSEVSLFLWFVFTVLIFLFRMLA